MTGQLNTNLMNSNSEEIQEELDTLSNRLDGVESTTSANTDKINEVGNRVDNLANCVSTDSLNATNVAACNIQGSSATITDINANNITACNKIKAAIIEADNITGNINGDISANRINVCSAHTINVNATGKITAADAKITTINAATAKICQSLTAGTLTTDHICNTGDATIAGCLNVKGICLTNGSNLYGNAVDVFSVWSRGIICGLCHANIDGNLTVKGTINGNCICGKNITSNRATIASGTIDNLTVNCALTVAEGITLTNVLGDTTLTKVTTDCLLVNGDTELNGAVKAGSITIGDGSITAGEVCIGAKGIVIDKDKNATLADVTANTVTTDAATISGKVTASCTESTDIVATNTFTENFYPVNITIDKNVGDLHYSRQLDTDAVGAVLVDCKTITPKEVTHSVFPKNGYIESEISAKETTYAKNKALEYSKRGNGLSVSSKVYRPDVCHSNYKTAVKFITGCSDPGITGCCGKGFTVENNGENGLSVSYFYDNCHCPFIDYNFCDTNKNTSTVISSCNLDVTSKNINVKNISTCSVSDDNKVLKVDNCGNVYSGKITSSLIGNDCKCYNDCTLRFSCIYQYPSNNCYYCINCETDGSYRRACQEMSCCAAKQCIIYCCYCTANPYNNEGRCYCTHTDTFTDYTEKRKWCCDWNRNTNEQFECIIDETETRNLGCPITNCVMFKKCCCNGNDPSKNTCVCYWDYTYNGLGGRYDSCGDYRGPQPSYFCRYTDGHPELGWRFSICDSNLYIANPQDGYKDILRVQDGKIYTKCGEFKSGGYFEDATFSNNCISGSRNVVNDTITNCVIKSVSSDVNCYSFETSTPNNICFGFGTNNCLTDSSPIPENNYNKSYFVYTPNTNTSVSCCCCYGPILCTEWSQQFRTICPLYKSNSCYNIVTNEYCYNYQQISPDSGNVICSCNIYKSNNCNSCYRSGSDKNSTRETCSSYCIIERPTDCCCVGTYYWCEANYCICCCHNVTTLNYDYYCERNDELYCTKKCFTNDAESKQCYTNSILTCCLSITPPYMCLTRNQYDSVVDGDGTEICLGNYRTISCDFVYNYSCSCGTLCGCSYEYDSGSYETCYSCYPQYDCTSQYTRYFNGDCLCGCKYNETTCQYEAFDVRTCININDKSIDKNVMINNCQISLKEKVTTNQIANLPITNTLVPLAGKVNGNGFAFFCKGADGTKFYDGAFATVDAGTATDVTYLVTTGV